MENQTKVLKELIALADFTKDIPKGNASFKLLKLNTGLSNEELDETLISLERDGYIIEYPRPNNDDVPFKLTDKGIKS